jgi:hypothetical protein
MEILGLPLGPRFRFALEPNTNQYPGGETLAEGFILGACVLHRIHR